MSAPDGNTNRANGKRFKLAMEKVIAEKLEGPDRWDALKLIATKALEQAAEGNAEARAFVRDTLDGRPAQSITGRDGEDLVINVMTGIAKVGAGG